LNKRLVGVISAYGFAALAVWVGLSFTKGNAPLAIGDPGELVRWAQPIVQTVKNLAMAMTVGSLVLAAWAFSEKSESLTRSIRRAALAANVWLVSGLAHFLLTYLWVTGSKLSGDQSFGLGLWQFGTEIELGKALLVNLGFAALVSIVALLSVSLRATLFAAAFAIAGLVPLALIGHAAGTTGHDMAVNSMGIHLVAVTIWVGGLIELGFQLRSENWLVLAKRYSTLALFAFGLTAVSGVAAAALRLVDVNYLLTPWGILVIAKVVILLALGGFGAFYRFRLLNAATPSKKSFSILAIVELALMGAAFGIGASLSRTASPSTNVSLGDLSSPAAILTGSPLPPELTFDRWFTSYKIDLVWLVVVLVATSLYLFGVARLRKRGDEWPIGRTISWLLGMALLLWITSGPLNVYEQYLFSVHMLAHMILTMGVPVLLVPGSPVTLLLRSSEARKDDSMGLREWVLWAVHTPWAKLVSNPIFAAINFAASLVIFYFTPLFGWSTRDHLGHEWMIVHFLITGYLFVQALISIDPGPDKLPYLLRLMLLIGTLAFHAFFGLSLMSGEGLLLPEWYGAMGRLWGEAPIADQQTGGAIAWGIGEMPAAVLTIIVSIQWFRSDSREAKRLDRASDRSGNKDVEDYNAMLAKLAKRDGEQR
jgi:cytochrome c oxidase assembly factor CtaG/putative copper export protein